MITSKYSFFIVIASLFIITLVVFFARLAATQPEVSRIPGVYPDRINILLNNNIQLGVSGNHFTVVSGDHQAVEQLNSILQNYHIVSIQEHRGVDGLFTLFVPGGTDLSILSQKLKDLPTVKSTLPVPVLVPLR